MNPASDLLVLGSIEKTVVTMLAVAGGFLTGYLVTGLIAHLLGKFTFGKQAPPRLTWLVKAAGGTAAAIGVYLMISTEGGFGLGGTGGGEALSKTGADPSETAKQDASNVNAKRTASRSKENEEDLRGNPLSVHVLGPGTVDEKDFRIGDDAEALTAEEVVQRIEQLDKAGKIKVKQIRMKVSGDSTPALRYARMYSMLRQSLEPRGFEIIPLKDDEAGQSP